MNILLIETFLAVVRNRNITQAANQLYVSQSTVSTRLLQLENELGVQLIKRSKGIRNVELTSKGIDFIGIAQNYASVNKKIEKFSSEEHHIPLTIACPDSINIHMFGTLYRQLLELDPHIDLRIRTQQSPEIYNIVDEHKADVGFVFHQSHYKNILSENVLQEDMKLILSSNGNWHDGAIHPSELDSSYELYLPWSADIVHWHDYWWQGKPYAQFDTASMIVSFLTHPKSWALCPVSVVKTYVNDPNIIIRDCSVEIPQRKLYMLTERSNSESEAVQIFTRTLHSFLENYSNVYTLL